MDVQMMGLTIIEKDGQRWEEHVFVLDHEQHECTQACQKILMMKFKNNLTIFKVVKTFGKTLQEYKNQGFQVEIIVLTKV